MNILISMLAAGLVMALAAPSLAAKQRVLVDLDKHQGDVEFLAIGNPSFLKIRGKKAKVTGKLLVSESFISGKLRVPLADFDTGMSLRNRHMKEDYLKVKEFPYADLKFAKVALSQDFLNSTSAEVSDVPFQGTLTLHGQTKPMKGKASFKRSGGDVTGKAEFKIDLTQFGIEIPSFKGITVAKEVTITTKIAAPVKRVSLK